MSKDKESRKRLDDLVGLSGDEQQLLNDLHDVSIKGCPKRKHPVLVVKQSGISFTTDTSTTGEWAATYFPLTDTAPEYYRCLTCGSRFTCSNECVCKLVEE